MSVDGFGYVLSDGLAAAALPDLLAGHVEIEVGAGRVASRTFYDTFDGRMNASGMALVGEGARLSLLDGGDSREVAAADWQRAAAPVLLAGLRPGRLRDLLAPIIGVRAATPVARLRIRQRELRVLDRA